MNRLVIAEIPDPRNPSPHPYYYISNHRGDTLAVLDYLYNTAVRYEYDAYGNVIEKTGSYTPRYTFSTKEYIENAGLYLYAYRVYDPVAGRWTQRDPIDYQDSANLYCFCGNNPMNAWDPDGRSWTKGVARGLIGLGIGVAVGAVLVATAPAAVVVGAAVAGAALGGFHTGLKIGEAVTGQEAFTGRALSQDERTTAAGEAVVGLAAIAVLGTKWASKGGEHDWGVLAKSPAQRMAYERGSIPLTDTKFSQVQSLPPAQRPVSYTGSSGKKAAVIGA